MTEPFDRDRARTEERILDALRAIVAEKGFSAVGVNAVADRAGVGKPLIYRYFGDMDGLLAAYARLIDPLVETPIPERPNSAQAADILIRQSERIRKDREFRELLRWQLFAENEATAKIDAEREEMGREIIRRIEEAGWARAARPDAVGALLSAGLTYLALRTDTTRWYNGIDLRSEDGWAVLEATVRDLIDALAEKE